MEVQTSLNWTFFGTTSVPKHIEELFVPGEQADAAYKTVRDVAVFTNKRLIVADSQGITGRKKEIFSIPYKAINMWSTENAGTFDIEGEIQLWTRAGMIKITLRKGIDVHQLDQLIAKEILG